MTVPIQTPYDQHTANGSTATFAYNFLILDEDDIDVYLGEVLQSSGYSVTGVGASSGGTVVFTSNPANNTVVTLVRNASLSRSTDYQTSGDFKATVVNTDFDKTWLAIQQLNNKIERLAPLFSEPQLASIAATRANYLLSFDSNGIPETSLKKSDVQAALNQYVSGVQSTEPWTNFSGTPTQTSATTFTVTGDQTSTFAAGTRLRFTDSSTLYGIVISSAYTSLTTVTVVLDSGSLSGSLTSVETSVALVSELPLTTHSAIFNYLSSGCVNRSLYNIVKDWGITIKMTGAVGNNSNDDTSAITAAWAIADAVVDQEVAVYWPQGFYRITQLDFTNLRDVTNVAMGSVVLIGTDTTSTYEFVLGCDGYDAGTPANSTSALRFNFNGDNGRFVVNNLLSATYTVSVKLYACVECDFRYFSASGSFTNATVDMQYAFVNSFYRGQFSNTNDGSGGTVYVFRNRNNNTNLNIYDQLRISGTSDRTDNQVGIGLRGSGSIISGCDVSAIREAVRIDASRGSTLVGNYMEAVLYGITCGNESLSPAKGCSVTGGFIETESGGAGVLLSVGVYAVQGFSMVGTEIKGFGTPGNRVGINLGPLASHVTIDAINYTDIDTKITGTIQPGGGIGERLIGPLLINSQGIGKYKESFISDQPTDGEITYESRVNDVTAQQIKTSFNPNNVVIDSGTTDSTTANKLVDSSQNFVTTVTIGDIAKNTTDDTCTIVTAIDSNTTLSVADDIFTTGEDYEIRYATKAEFTRPQGLPVLTVAQMTRYPAAKYAGCIVMVSDDAVQTYTLAFSDGANWKVLTVSGNMS